MDGQACGSAWLCKTSPQSAQGVGMRPQKYEKNQCHRLHGFICTFIGILVSNLIIAYALIDTSVDFATVQK